jgi:hypothetical protein
MMKWNRAGPVGDCIEWQRHGDRVLLRGGQVEFYLDLESGFSVSEGQWEALIYAAKRGDLDQDTP